MKTVITILNSSIPLPAHFHIRIDNPPFMPLVIEGIGAGPRGLPAISVGHYGLQNGDAMRDPEVCFEAEFKDGQIVELYPYCWRNDYLGIEQFAVEQDGRDPTGKKLCRVDHKVIFGLLELATTWDKNLAAQRFDSVFVRQLRERRN